MNKRNFYCISFYVGEHGSRTTWRWKPPFQKKISEDFNWIELSPIFNLDSNSFSVEKDWPCWEDDNSFIIFSSIWSHDYMEFYKKLGYDVFDNIMINFFKDYKDLFFNYKGKMLFVNDEDGFAYNHNQLKLFDYIDRIDGFITFNISKFIDHDHTQLFSPELYEKSILLPARYDVTWMYDTRAREAYLLYANLKIVEKKRKIVFYGGFDINRFEIVKRIKNSKLSSYFDGGITTGSESCPIPDEFEKENDDIFTDRLWVPDYLNKMNESLISMCGFQTTGTFSYRHVESMKYGCVIISGDFSSLIDHNFLHRDKILPLMYIFKQDFSDLIEVCQYCLDNENEVRIRGEEGREVYKKYWEMDENGTYKPDQWQAIKNQFLELNMKI